MKKITLSKTAALACLMGLSATGCLWGSSHREAPLITTMPKLDCTDFYMFNSYEEGRSDSVTIIANYIPLQDPGGGPNYFTFDPDAVYEIHIDNDADAVEDITFQFQFTNTIRGLTLDIGASGETQAVAVPVINIGGITVDSNAALNVDETYTAMVLRGPRRQPQSFGDISNLADGSTEFTKPADNIGNKSIPDYDAYASQYIYDINIPGCGENGRLFVGQRKDSFVVNLGETFDLINISTSPLGPVSGNSDTLAGKNITSIILEVDKTCLVDESAIIAGWTTASKVEGSEFTQVSRLGHPLVNELVIGVPDKDAFNASEPKDDGQFLTYVTHPTLPAIIEILYGAAGAIAPTNFPRDDLVDVFLTGVPGLNEDGSVGEMLRLNTDIAAVGEDSQHYLGVIAGDTAGFPNGRRPGDDVVDIALRVVMGKLVPNAEDAPAGEFAFTDGAKVDAGFFDSTFPYLKSPLPGSPNDLTPAQSFFDFVAAANSDTDDEVFFFDLGFDSWIYTDRSIYPYFYIFASESWVFYLEGTTSPRTFFDFATGENIDVNGMVSSM